MKTPAPPAHAIGQHRKNLKRLAGELAKHPFELLPERSVDCLNQFLAGYSIFGSPIWRDMSGFELWLADNLSYPQDTGARWWRFIQLNSRDDCDSYDLFFRLYSRYSQRPPIDREPNASEFTLDRRRFDFYLNLFAIGRKPGMYLGSGDRVQSVAAYLSGYFKGKSDARIRLTRDEKEFLRFEEWLRRHHKFKKHYPWYRLIEMWPYNNMNSFDCFFANYDAYLTNYGKRPRGLDDLFEILYLKTGTTIQRREKPPKRVLQIPETRRHWRGYYFGWKPQS